MKPIVTVTLVLSLAFTPLLAARQASPTTGAQTPWFTSTPLRFESRNGFSITTGHHGNHVDLQATSPWGESLTFHYHAPGVQRPDIIEIEFGSVTLRTRLGLDRTPEWVQVDVLGQRVTQRAVGRQLPSPVPGREFAGQVADWSAYRTFVQAALQEAGIDFWAGVSEAFREFDESLGEAVPAGCTLSCITCFAALLGYVGTMASITAACVGTFGAACLAAILAHEGGAIVMGAVCADCGACLMKKED